MRNEAARKVPTVTLIFWIMKICATTLGETGGDLLSMTLGLGYAASTLLFMGFLTAALAGQLIATRYVPLLYWAVILATSTAGTTLSDFMDRTLHLGYAAGAAILGGSLLAILAAWKTSGLPMRVDTVQDRRAELFYWATILVSNTLGTALGDFLSDDSGLGFGGGAAVIGCGLALTVAAYSLTSVSRTALFWIAFVLTRPFGATMGDLLTKTHDQGGLGFGTVGASAVLGGVLAGLILLESVRLSSSAAGASVGE